MRILAIGAHSDDVDFFCGGTLARFASQGHVIGICSMTDGRTGGKAATPDELARIRREEFLESAAVIGAQGFWPGIHTGELFSDKETRRLLVDLLLSFKPNLIITHPPGDYHPDHVATTQLVMDASFVARNKNPAAGSVHPSGVAALLFCDSELGHNFIPDDYVDVTDAWAQKTRMLDAHRTQYSGWQNPRTGQPENWVLDRAVVLSRFRGLQCGRKYAEAFQFYRAHGRVRPARLVP
jgi:N-acetylglucosamine malate deacetylase 1